jgi:K+-sensing histidine kinase KdpD
MAEGHDPLASLLHDLRSPLAVVDVYSGVLERDDGRLSLEQRAEFSRRIRSAVAEMRDALDRALPDQPL